MYLSEIKARIEALTRDTSTPDVRTLQTDVENAWQHAMLEKLSGIFLGGAGELGETTCLQQCEALLREMWPLIQGTSVSYTAMPDAALTSILIDIASLIADGRNQVWRSEVQHELASHQEDWLALESDYLNKQSACIQQVQNLLQEKWHFEAPIPGLYTRAPHTDMAGWVKQLEQNIKHVPGPEDAWRAEVTDALHALVPESIAAEKAYQAIRRAFKDVLQSSWDTGKALPELYYDHPGLLAERFPGVLKDLSREANYNALSILMPGVYQGDVSHQNASDVLKTHVLSDSGQYLYPVSLIADVNLTDELEALPYNPHYDETRGDADQQISTTSWHRLVTHSSDTEAVIHGKTNYQEISTQNHHLLGQLTTLIHQLALNDAHGGRGTGDDAAGFAYPALIRFKNYYEALPEDEQAKVPPQVKEQIDLLLDVAFNPVSSVRAENPMQTCIGTRRESLYAAMQGHDVLLASISTGEGTRQKLIEISRETFDQAQEKLRYALEHRTYTGKDNLGITRALLEQLDISIQIKSLADVNFVVQGMEAQTLAEFLAQDEVQTQIMAQVRKLEDLVILIMETSNTKLPVVLHALEEYVGTLIRTPQDLAALLISLQVDKVDTALQTLLNKLPQIINNGRGLGAVLRHLTVEQCRAAVAAMKDKLPPGVNNFLDVLKFLTPEQRTIFIEGMKDKLPEIIKTGFDFRDVLEHLTPEQRTFVFEAMKDKLPEIIHGEVGFQNALKHLPTEQRTFFIDSIKDKLPEMIRGAFVFNVVLNSLTLEQRMVVCEVMKDKLPEMIRSAHGFRWVLEVLVPEQHTIFIEGVKDKLPRIIQDASDFRRGLELLMPEQRTIFIEGVKDKLPLIIQDIDSFVRLLKSLTPEQRTVVYEGMKGKLPKMIRSAYDFSSALEHLTPELRTFFIDSMKDKLPKMIRSAYVFNFTLESLAVEQRTVVYERMKDKLPRIIHNIHSFVSVLNCLTPEQCSEVCGAMVDELPEYIRDAGGNFDANNFARILGYLSADQCSVVCGAMVDELPEFIRDAGDFSHILGYLLAEQRSEVYEAMKDRLHDMIQDGRDFGLVLEYLMPEQRMVIYEVMKDKLPAIIDDVSDLGLVVEPLTSEYRVVVIEAVKDKLVGMILRASAMTDEQSLSDVFLNCMRLSFQLSINFFEALQPEPREERSVLYPKGVDLNELQHNLTQAMGVRPPEVSYMLYHAMKKQLPAGFDLESLVTPPALPNNLTDGYKQGLCQIIPDDEGPDDPAPAA